MKLGVLADIHGNYEAFKACLEYLEKQKVDAYIFLGDYSGEFPHPEKTMKLIFELMEKKKCYLIKGNKEEYLEEGVGAPHPEWDEYKSILGMLRYSYNHLNEDEKAFLRELPISDTVLIDGFPPIRICHGWTDSTRTKILPNEEKNKILFPEIPEDYILTAHTHNQFETFECGKRVCNPGSVGVVHDGSKKTHCLIAHGINGEWKFEFVKLPYNIEAEKAAMREEGLGDVSPQWTRLTEKSLEGYKVYHSRALKHAMELCRKETGNCVWPMIPEDIMERAVTEYFDSIFS